MRTVCVLAASMAMGAALQGAEATTAIIDASTNVVGLDSSTSGFNDAVTLEDHAGSVTVQMAGSSIFGSQPGETWDSAPIVYTDAAGKLQYAVTPNNGSTVVTGSHYQFAFLADNDISGNAGTTTMTELNAASNPITSGTINTASMTPVQTGVALLTATNAQFFLTPPTPGFYNVSVTGSATYDASGDQFGSVVVQFRDPTNGITYAPLAIGSSQTFYGFRFYVFIAEPTELVGTGSGQLTVNFTAVPEPASLGVAGAAGAALLLRRRR